MIEKQVLLTGSSRGIGKAIALQLAEKGCRIALHHHQDDIENAREVLKEVQEKGGSGFLFAADLNDPQNAIALGNQVWEKLGKVDFLINNAGVSYKKHFLDASIADIDYFMNINFKSTLLLTQTIARKMVEDAIEGSIYTITSINGIQPGVGQSIYGATKGAVEVLMKGIALELAPHRIKVNTIAAGSIQTDMNKAVWMDSEKLQLVNDHVPLGRMGQVSEIANTIVSLLYTGSYMTGSTIIIDGGWMMNQGFNKPKPYNNTPS